MNSLKISPRLTKLIDNADDNVVLHTKYECDDWKCFLLLFTSACACSYNKLVLHVWSRKKFELFISKNIWKFLYSLYCFSLVYYPKIPKYFGNFRSVNIFLDHFDPGHCWGIISRDFLLKYVWIWFSLFLWEHVGNFPILQPHFLWQ